jgi:hypothetical protein
MNVSTEPTATIENPSEKRQIEVNRRSKVASLACFQPRHAGAVRGGLTSISSSAGSSAAAAATPNSR